MVERRDRDTPGGDNVRPGLHVFGASAGEDSHGVAPSRSASSSGATGAADEGAGYGVVWCDPRRLEADVTGTYVLRREDLIEDPGREIVEADRSRAGMARKR